jgi:hypothetical protein
MPKIVDGAVDLPEHPPLESLIDWPALRRLAG